MAEQVLDCLNRDAGLEHMGGERMAECMGRDSLLDAGNFRSFFN